MSIIEILNSQQFMRKHNQLMYDALFFKDLTPSERGAYVQGLNSSLRQLYPHGDSTIDESKSFIDRLEDTLNLINELSISDDFTIAEYKVFVKGLEDTLKLLNEFIISGEQNS